MSKRWDLMVEKYGSEEAAKAEMRRRAENSSRNRGKTGGFASMDKDKLIAAASKGGKKGKKT